MPWSEVYRTGCEIIDNDHMRLVDVYDHLLISLENRLPLHKLDNIITEFIRVVSEHSTLEHRIMSEIGYNSIDAHIADHERVMEAISSMISKFQKGNYTGALEIALLAGKWEATHVERYDRPLAVFVNETQKILIASCT